MKEREQIVCKNEKLSIRKQCELLSVNRSNLYYEKKPESQVNQEIMKKIDEHDLNFPTHGVLRMQDFLLSNKIKVNHKRLRRLLRKMGIIAIYPKKNLSKLGDTKFLFSCHS